MEEAINAVGAVLVRAVITTDGSPSRLELGGRGQGRILRCIVCTGYTQSFLLERIEYNIISFVVQKKK